MGPKGDRGFPGSIVWNGVKVSIESLIDCILLGFITIAIYY